MMRSTCHAHIPGSTRACTCDDEPRSRWPGALALYAFTSALAGATAWMLLHTTRLG